MAAFSPSTPHFASGKEVLASSEPACRCSTLHPSLNNCWPPSPAVSREPAKVRSIPRRDGDGYEPASLEEGDAGRPA
jgi:hypothetical protein